MRFSGMLNHFYVGEGCGSGFTFISICRSDFRSESLELKLTSIHGSALDTWLIDMDPKLALNPGSKLYLALLGADSFLHFHLGMIHLGFSFDHNAFYSRIS